MAPSVKVVKLHVSYDMIVLVVCQDGITVPFWFQCFCDALGHGDINLLGMTSHFASECFCDLFFHGDIKL